MARLSRFASATAVFDRLLAAGLGLAEFGNRRSVVFGYLRGVAIAVCFMLVVLPLHADVLGPGDSGPPDVFTTSSTVTPLDVVTGTFSYSFINGGTITGTYTDAVFYDPFGVTCSNCLDFAMEVSVDSGAPGELLDVFYGAWRSGGGTIIYSTDVGYVPGSGGGDDPTTVSRGPEGVDMGFTLASPLTAGGSTDFFVIATNATSYLDENLSSGDTPLALTGSNLGIESLSDISIPGEYLVPVGEPVPEPSSFWLIRLVCLP